METFVMGFYRLWGWGSIGIMEKENGNYYNWVLQGLGLGF